MMDEPKPRGAIGIFPKPCWDTGNRTSLPREFTVPSQDYLTLLDERRSGYTFGDPTLQEISTCLYVSCRTVATDRKTPHIVYRPYPTAGALGSVTIAIAHPSLGAWIYDPSSHARFELGIGLQEIRDIRLMASNIFPIQDAALMLFFADRRRIESRYDAPETLVLRESGGMSATLGLTARALGLAYRPYGTLALEMTSKALGVAKDLIIPAGAAALGRGVN